MKIAVCIKQVPLSTKINIDPISGTLIRAGNETQINPYDEYAIEEAIKIREHIGGTITVYTMGPSQAKEILKDALAMGVDNVKLITDKVFAGSDTLATSYILSQAIKTDGIPDLIICGKQAIDGDTAQVGPSLSQLLEASLATNVQNIKSIQNDKIVVEQMMDSGYWSVELKVPSVITVVKGINTPRIANLEDRLKAELADIDEYNASSIKANIDYCGLNGSPTQVHKSYSPKRNIKAEKISGSSEALTEKLISLISPFIKGANND